MGWGVVNRGSGKLGGSGGGGVGYCGAGVVFGLCGLGWWGRGVCGEGWW